MAEAEEEAPSMEETAKGGGVLDKLVDKPDVGDVATSAKLKKLLDGPRRRGLPPRRAPRDGRPMLTTPRRASRAGS